VRVGKNPNGKCQLMKIKEIAFVIRFSLIVIVVGLLLTGCSEIYNTRRDYPGPALPQNQVAVIKAQPSFNTGCSISGVDGKSYSYYSSEVKLLPGRHTISIVYHETRIDSISYYSGYVSKAPLNIDIDTVAGHTYTVIPYRQGNEWGVRILDDNGIPTQ